MAIHFISGKPGGGKTLYAVKLIVDELVFGKREIFTNVPLHVGRLNEYLQERWPSRDCNVVQRVRLLDDSETGRFFSIRPGGVQVPVLSKEEWSAGKKPVYPALQDGGVMYVIDEVHNFFNARAWAETGRDVLFYLSQHRKLGDTVICITQAVMNVDKQFRSVTQDYTYLRNLKKESYGFFRLPGVFVRRTFTTPPSDTSEAMETGTFRLDVSGLASCYDTAQGVGIHARGADREEKRSGLPWWAFVVAVFLLLFAIVQFVPRLGGYLFSSKRAMAKAGIESPVRGTNADSVAKRFDLASPGPDTSLKYRGRPEDYAPPAETNTVKMAGYALLNGTVTVFLTDGRSVRYDSGDINLFSPSGVVIRGRYYERATPPRGIESVGAVQPERPASTGVVQAAEPGVPQSTVVVIGQSWSQTRYQPQPGFPRPSTAFR
ncbi:MAG TPA: zonular occludens toxin domain-containing protein [Verrucomicrobiae bacterium]|nr:zonular occludens toxin domain-containing protein [Verrucomicrobiae bacterium]